MKNLLIAFKSVSACEHVEERCAYGPNIYICGVTEGSVIQQFRSSVKQVTGFCHHLTHTTRVSETFRHVEVYQFYLFSTLSHHDIIRMQISVTNLLHFMQINASI